MNLFSWRLKSFEQFFGLWIAISALESIAYLGFAWWNQLKAGTSTSLVVVISQSIILLILWIVVVSRRFNLKSHLLNGESKARSILLVVAGLLVSAALIPDGILPGILQKGLQYYRGFLLLIGLACLQALVILMWFVIHQTATSNKKQNYLRLFISLGVIFSAWLWIALTGSGYHPDLMISQAVGPPVLYWQIWLGILATVGLIEVEKRLRPGSWLARHWDFILGAALILFAFVYWMALPIQHSYYAPRVQPPTYQVFPYSDAMYYTYTAETVLAGGLFEQGQVAPRPLFLALLTYLVGITQGNYQLMVIIQTAIYTLIPWLLFLIGKRIHSWSAGWLAATLFIFREANAILSNRYILTAHSKLILSDLPTLLLSVALIYFLLRWWKAAKVSAWFTLFIGGWVGVLMLFRTQTVVYLAPIGLMILLDWLRKKRISLVTPAILLAGLVLVISPYLIRNYSLTGLWKFDRNDQKRILLQSYLPESAGSLAGYTDAEVDQLGVFSTMLAGLREDPARIGGFIGSHFMRNGVCTLFAVPPQPAGFGLDSLFKQSDIWQRWDFSVSFSIFAQIGILLGILAVGLSLSWKRYRWLGLMPLLFYLVYAVSLSLARSSCGRYLLEVDWIGYFYQSIAIAAFLIWLFNPTQKIQTEEANLSEAKSKTYPSPKWWVLLVGAGLLLVGSLTPITEHLFPTRYPDEKARQIIEQAYQDSPSLVEWVSKMKSNGLGEPNIIYGRMLYPRYYKSGEGEPGSYWVAFSPKDYAHTGFLVVNQNGMRQVVVSSTKPPKKFINRMDVVVLGYPDSSELRGASVDYFYAGAVVLISESGNQSIYIPE